MLKLSLEIAPMDRVMLSLLCIVALVQGDVYLPHSFESSTINESVIDVASFEFEDIGTYFLAIKAKLYEARASLVQTRTMLHLLVCNEDEYQYISSNRDGYCRDGSFVNKTLCESHDMAQNFTGNSYYYNVDIKIKGSIAKSFDGLETFHFLVANCEIDGGKVGVLRSCDLPVRSQQRCFRCDNLNTTENTDGCTLSPPIKTPLTVEMDYLFCTNEKGCLKGTDRATEACYIAAAILWGVGFFAWGIFIVLTRRHAMSFHIYLLTVPLINAISAFVHAYEWGRKDTPLTVEEYDTLTQLSHVTINYVWSVDTVIISFVALGWRIIRVSISRKEKVAVFGLILLQVLILNFGLSIARFLVLLVEAYFIRTFVNRTIMSLRYQMDLLIQNSIDPQATPVYTKYKIFIAFRFDYLRYTVLLVTSMIAIAVGYSSSVLHAAIQVLRLVFYYRFGKLFRCRPFVYDYHVVYSNAETENVQFGILEPSKVVKKQGILRLVDKEHEKHARALIILQPNKEQVLAIPCHRQSSPATETNEESEKKVD